MAAQILADHIYIATDTSVVYTRPLNIEGFNAIHVQATMLSAASGKTVTISAETSNDQENWVAVTAFTGFTLTQGGTASDQKLSDAGTICSAWVRLKLTGNAGCQATVAISVNLVNR